MEPFPTQIAPHGTIYTLAPQPPGPRYNCGGLAKWYTGDGRLNWPFGGTLPFAYKCQIVNYGDMPVVNLEVVYELTYGRWYLAGEEVPEPAQREPTTRHKCTITIDKIDPGAGNPFTFYLYNEFLKQHVVHITVSKTATVELIGDPTRHKVPLSHSGGFMALAPDGLTTHR